MRLIGKDILEKYSKVHADVRSQIAAWIAEAETAEWKSFQDIKKMYPSASNIRKGRVVFNIKGNSYRLDVRIAYNTLLVQVVRIGTHEDYDSWTF